jgi:hypothetical protein
LPFLAAYTPIEDSSISYKKPKSVIFWGEWWNLFRGEKGEKGEKQILHHSPHHLFMRIMEVAFKPFLPLQIKPTF